MSLSLFCKLTTKTIPNSNTHIAQHSRSCRCSKATRNRRWQLGHCSRLTQRRRSSKKWTGEKTLHDQRLVSTIQMRLESRSEKIGMKNSPPSSLKPRPFFRTSVMDHRDEMSVHPW
jgi:hypothetical protein